MRIFNRYNMFQNNLTVTIKDIIQGVKSLSSSLKIKIEFLFKVYTPNLGLNAKSLQPCLTLCDPTDCSLSGSSVHGIFQAKILN